MKDAADAAKNDGEENKAAGVKTPAAAKAKGKAAATPKGTRPKAAASSAADARTVQGTGQQASSKGVVGNKLVMGTQGIIPGFVTSRDIVVKDTLKAADLFKPTQEY